MDSPSTRHVLDLTGWWHTWFDTAADWRVAPPPDPRTPPERLAPHAPSAGWEGMDEGMESLRVPGTWAESRPGYRGVAWHWRPLIVPPEYAGHTLWLRFEGVRLAAEVYLDRRLVGYDLDGLTPFEVDVTHLLRPNHRHELALRVTNPGGVLAGQGPQPVEWAGLRLPPSHDYGGLWGAVSLVARPAAHLGDVWAEGGETDDEVLVHATVRSVDGERAVRVAAHLLGDPARPLGASEQVALYLAAGDAREVTLPLRAAGLEPWSPERPALYRVRVTLAGEGFADALEAPYAPRRLGWTDAGYTLNGAPFEVRAARTEGWYPETLAFPSERLAEDEVRAARRLGFSALHLVGHVPTEALLAAADREGLLVLQDAALLAAGGEGDLERHLAADRRARLEARLRAHPAVLWAVGDGEGLTLAERPPEPAEPPRPVVRAIGPARAGLPDPPAILRRYGDRMLPGSDAEAWASNLLTLSRGFGARGLERVFPDVASLTRATARAAYREVAEGISRARCAHGAGYEWARWADEPRGPLGLLDVHRAAKADETPLAAANAPLVLVLEGAPSAQRVGAEGSLSVRAVNRGAVRGAHALQVRLTAPNGRLVFEEAGWVSLAGLPVEELAETPYRLEGEGEFVLRVALSRDGQPVAAARRSVWAVEVPPPSSARGLSVLGPPGALSGLLGRWGVRHEPYVLGTPTAGLLVTAAGAAAGGLANVLFAGAVRRVAWLLPDPTDLAAGWGALLPPLGSTVTWPSGAEGRGWLIGGRHPLLRGAGDPGLWWHAGAGLLPRYGLRDGLETTLVTFCQLAGEGAPGLATAMGIDRLGEAELLYSALPLVEAAAGGDPVAERLLANVIAWL